MSLDRATVRAIRGSASAIEIVGQKVSLRRAGRDWRGLCPFHDEATPSFFVAADGRFHCWGCGAKGDFICLVRRLYDFDFLEAIDFLQEHGGSHEAFTSPASFDCAKFREQPRAQFRITSEELDQFRIQLMREFPSAEPYVSGRGISWTVAANLRWGWSYQTFRLKDGSSTQPLPCLAIPHFHGDKCVGLSFRHVLPDGTKLFTQITGSKTSGLYGLSELRVDAESITVVEGPPDVGLLLSHNINAVGYLSAQSEILDSDIRLLSHFPKIFLCGDVDGPGTELTNRLAAKLPSGQVYRPRLPGDCVDVTDLWRKDADGFAGTLQWILKFAEGL